MVFYISFITFNLIIMCVFSKNIVVRSGFENPDALGVGLKLFAVVNNNGDEDLVVEGNPDECCLETGDNHNMCDIITLIGDTLDTVNVGKTRTLSFVAPLLDPYNRKGYCTIHIDSRPISRSKAIARETVQIKFDTTLNKRHKIPVGAKICSNPDEDPLNNCNPVNCDVYYNGKKLFYHNRKKRCVNIPKCVDNVETDTPGMSYNPITNKCVTRLARSITKNDIDMLKSAVSKKRTTKDIFLLNSDKKSNKTIYDLYDIEDQDETNTNNDSYEEKSPNTFNESSTTERLYKIFTKTYTITDGSTKPSCILKQLFSNRFTLFILVVIIMLQCFLICTLGYCFFKTCRCKNKEVVKKFFNDRQDVTVTTPLIATSNLDTGTTDFHYSSESSNGNDKKIKCYKACQKERKNNIKFSMSDDILSKCLTRRDWTTMPRSETIPEVNVTEETKMVENKPENVVKNVKVNFETDLVKDHIDNLIQKAIKEEHAQSEACDEMSEKEIRCHSFNREVNSSATLLKSDTKVYRQEIKKKSSESREKCAQANFSNDSIDDYLSERGVVFIGDNPSKYSFSSQSTIGKSSETNPSNKTSKNNVLKNVMSLLKKKKKGPSSDPGTVKSSNEVDLEVLHMSTASIGSSSYSDGDKESNNNYY